MSRALSLVVRLVVLALPAASACAPHAVVTQAETPPGITVTGEGEVHAAPDMARVRLGVEQRAPSAQVAMQLANQRMTQISNAVQAHGVAPKDLQTTDLSLYFERERELPMPEEGREAPARSPSGVYVVRNTLVVSVRQIGQLGVLIGAAMEAGANHLDSLELTLADPSALQDEARKRAVADATAKARLLAQQAGVKLGPVRNISELGIARPMMAQAGALRVAKESVAAIEQGELSLSQSVQLVFALEH